MKRRTLVLVIVVAAVVVVAGVSVYILTRPPSILLSVTTGSTAGDIGGDLKNTSCSVPGYIQLAALTYANQTGHLYSILFLGVESSYCYVNAYYGHLDVVIDVVIMGHFAPNLHPSGLQLTANATGGYGDSLYFWPGNRTGENVSFDRSQSFSVTPSPWGTGSGRATATFVNDSGATYYDFGYRAQFEAYESLSRNESVGFRATVAGVFTPSVSVGILLYVVNGPT